MNRKWPVVLLLMACAGAVQAQTPYVPPVAPSAVLNFNPGWKFIRQDMPGAQDRAFDDAAWSTISTPHTYNDVDTFNRLISHSGGQQGAYMGPAWYRKHFKLPPDLQGRKLILEFEGMRQAARFYVNGKELGLFENGITAYGLDITGAVQVDADNVLAVRIDNSDKYLEEATRTGFQWESKDFNPNYGGLHQRVWLHVSGKIYQTLPIWEGLKTTGTYIYPSDISIGDKTATVNVESQVANESGDQSPVTLSVAIVDSQGVLRAKFDGDTVDMVNGEKSTLKASGKLTGAEFWSPDHPALYDVYTILSTDNKVIDVKKTATGFRKAEFRGGAGTGGVYINDKFTYLTGYAQRSTNEWAGLGQSYPDWMHDLNARILRDSHANYMRWMHISPQKVDVEACDRAGIVEVCPAGDKERDVDGVQWNQRVAVMRDSIIYYRNNPSILFWEAGNTVISPAHMSEMVALRKELDPNGGRVMGTRGDSNNEKNTSITPIAEYYGVMIGQDQRTDALQGPSDMFRAYSAQRRDRAPLIETEDFRDEGARRFWDNSSPPHFGFKKGPQDTYAWNSETFCLAAALRYNAYELNRISNSDPAHSKWAGYASIYFFDSNADGRQQSSEVCRVSGKVDALRLPKEIYYTYQVMQNPQPQVHIIGHWSYPAGTKKTVYVAGNTRSVELLLNGQSIGKSDTPACIAFDKEGNAILNSGESTGYIFAFPDVPFTPGILRAVGSNDGKPAAEYELKTAGPPAALRLTPHTGPRGLQADGQDVAFFDVEVVDADGQRCPTDESRVDFEVTGPCIWRGGYNSGTLDSTNKTYLNTECGINRVAIRSTLTPGAITLKAVRKGLSPASVSLNALPFAIDNGITAASPPR